MKIVADLIQKNGQDTSANVADQFIEQVLVKACERIKETIPEEEDLTLEELKSRPQGKAELSDRSCLHDDITCVIIQFKTDTAMVSQVTSKLTLSSTDPAQMARELFVKIDINGKPGTALAHALWAVLTALGLWQATAGSTSPRSLRWRRGWVSGSTTRSSRRRWKRWMMTEMAPSTAASLRSGGQRYPPSPSCSSLVRSWHLLRRVAVWDPDGHQAAAQGQDLAHADDGGHDRGGDWGGDGAGG